MDYTDICARLACLTMSNTANGAIGFSTTIAWEGTTCGNGKVRCTSQQMLNRMLLLFACSTVSTFYDVRSCVFERSISTILFTRNIAKRYFE